MLTDRQKKLLNHIVEDYIETAVPVGSSYLVKKFNLGVSDATVRNDCQILEKEGFIVSPHTSAGRIPTEVGYSTYLENKGIDDHEVTKSLLSNDQKTLEKVYKQALSHVENPADPLITKSVAKALAELSQSAVLVGFGKRDVYYTGLSYLFAQPEFNDINLVYTIGEVVDHLDDVFPDVFDEFDETVSIKIGSNNKFSSDCSFIGTKFDFNGEAGLIGLLGPMRMPYTQNVNRLKDVRHLLTN